MSDDFKNTAVQQFGTKLAAISTLRVNTTPTCVLTSFFFNICGAVKHATSSELQATV